MVHNHPNQFDAKAVNELNGSITISNRYSITMRSENAEKDYLISETNLNKVIGAVAIKNKDDLLENRLN